ncbi:MAG: hypothetical protein J5597_02040 [Spirochaetaceae bacterium]|nr:hypothetical protein [Spirochaetaceae bacterium]
MKKTRFFWFAISVFFLAHAALFGIEENWTMAAVPFTAGTSTESQEALEQAARTLPGLLLDYLEGSGNRVMEDDEIKNRVLFSLMTERQELFDQLSNELRTRDAVMFNSSTSTEKRKQKKQSDARIKELQEKIQNNLAKAANPLGIDETVKKKDLPVGQKVAYISPLRPGDKLSLVTWRDDSSLFFDKKSDDETEFDFEQRVVNAGISALLSGSVSERAGFLRATVSLSVYPGGEIAATVSDIGSITDLPALAEQLVQALYPAVINSKPVRLRFEINPPEAAKVAKIYVDGTSMISEEQDLQSGVHEITIDAAGFKSKEFSYDFYGEEEFLVRVTMREDERMKVFLDSTTSSAGQFYLNAIPVENAAETVLSYGTSIGEFESVEGFNDYFMLENRNPQVSQGPFKLQKINVRTSTSDISAEIEKSRKTMYNSYAALMLSMPLLFFSNGTQIASKNAYLYGMSDIKRSQNWMKMRNFSNALSITLGLNFAFQLGRYLYKANSILPQEIVVSE